MKTTNSLKVKSVLAILLIAAALFAPFTAFHTDALAAPAPALPDGMSLSAPFTAFHDAPAAPAAALPEGIYLSDRMTQQDAAYLAENLEYLHTQLPQWWEYVMDARPFTLSFDDTLAENGRAAITECCDAQGNGLVTFGYHLGQLTNSDDPGSETAEARKATFLGLLIHELTHVRDLRAGRFTTKTDRKSCIAAESSGLTQQLRVKRDLADKLQGDLAVDPAFRLWLDQQVKTEAADLRSRMTWDLYCGAFED